MKLLRRTQNYLLCNYFNAKEFMDKEEARRIAAFEQFGAQLGTYAGMLYEYFKHLTMSGFQRDESLQLVIELQKILFGQAFKSGPSTDDLEDF